MKVIQNAWGLVQMIEDRPTWSVFDFGFDERDNPSSVTYRRKDGRILATYFYAHDVIEFSRGLAAMPVPALAMQEAA